MSADDLDGVVERAAALLVQYGHVADGDEVRAAVRGIDGRVRALIDSGLTTYAPSAVAAIAVETTDRLATRILQGREPGNALVEVAFLHAIEGHALPASWWLPSRWGGEVAAHQSHHAPEAHHRVDLM